MSIDHVLHQSEKSLVYMATGTLSYTFNKDSSVKMVASITTSLDRDGFSLFVLHHGGPVSLPDGGLSVQAPVIKHLEPVAKALEGKKVQCIINRIGNSEAVVAISPLDLDF